MKKLSRKELGKIVREERTRVLQEQPRGGLVEEARMLADLDDIISQIEAVEKELYGLEDPQDPGAPFGEMLGKELRAQILRLNAHHDDMETHFNAAEFGRGI